ncbi:MAG: endonuclease/exonuclease/phosphatase family protein [Anaerolineales bacterium]|jgi:endonuclease/exonuclease/phosphatase family metal-dependent hydrolase
MTQLKVVTINILSDLALWDDRRALLVKGLADLQADLIALQEVNIPVNNHLWLAGKLGLPHVYLTPKTGEEGKMEGVAILSRHPFEEKACLDLRTQNRVAQYVKIHLDGQSLLFANGHLFWQPGESDERLNQITLLLEWLNAQPGKLPTIVCGDFNSTPNTQSIQRMHERFVSAYAQFNGKEPCYTAPTSLPRSKLSLLRTLLRYISKIRLSELSFKWRGTLDYIFINERLGVRDCQVILDRPAADRPRIYPSDHFGLYAELQIVHS